MELDNVASLRDLGDSVAHVNMSAWMLEHGMSELKVKSTRRTLFLPLSVITMKLCVSSNMALCHQIKHRGVRGPTPCWEMAKCSQHAMHLVVGDQIDRPIKRGVRLSP
jgi:hypothetical protein